MDFHGLLWIWEARNGEADHIEISTDLNLSVVLCLFWQFFHKESKRIDFRRIVKGTKAIAVLQQHIFFIHCALNLYACIPILNVDCLNWFPTKPEFRVRDLLLLFFEVLFWIFLRMLQATTLLCVSARLLWLKLPDICPCDFAEP